MDNNLVVENELLKQRVNELEEKLKKYTNGNNHKNYYEKNKEIVKEKGSMYLKQLKKMLPLLTSSLALIAALPLGSAAGVDRREIGFGATRLKHFNKHVLQGEGNATICANVEQYWFKEAVVDNFAPIERQQYWANEGQRYWLNKQFWSGPGAPIFVFIGGEGQESCGRLTSKMYMYTLAQQHNALLVNVEHRFYGQSYPTVDMSTANLSYLSSSQALADLARIIGHIKKELGSESSKVITVGGSYPGNLAAWFRLKYPSVTDGSIASSAPLTAQTNFPEYMDVVAQSLLYFSGQGCYDAFEAAANEVASLYEQGPGSAGWEQLNGDFKTCSPMQTKRDLVVLLSDLMGNIQGTIQYNNEHNGIMNATDICSTMLTPGSTPYQNFVTLSALYREQSGVSCEDASWGATLAWLTPIEMDPNNAARPWTYQTCNEFGYFQTTDSVHQPFHSWKPLNLAFYMDMCYEGFNHWHKEPQVDWINQMYGGVKIQGTNTVLVAGTIDPWHALGVTNYTVPSPQESQPTEVPVYILGTAHCNDLYAPAPSDTEALTHARQVIAGHVNGWLAWRNSKYL